MTRRDCLSARTTPELIQRSTLEAPFQRFTLRARERTTSFADSMELVVSSVFLERLCTPRRCTVFVSGIGLWLLFFPWVLRTSGAAADSAHPLGSLVLTVSVVSMAGVARAGRLLNVLAGIWIALAPWVLSGATTASRWTDLAVGAILILASLRRGSIRERYGSWNRCIV